MMENLMLVISRIVHHSPYVGLFVLLVLGVFGFPFPEDTTLILCGFLIASKVVMPVPAALLAFAGLMSADIIVFSFGRKYGRKIVDHKRFQKIISPGKLSLLENIFDKWGVLFVVVGRHIMGLRTQLFITAGVMRMPMWKFIVADAFTIPLTMLIMIGMGYLGGNSLRIIRSDMTRIEHWAILLAVILLVIYISVKFFKSENTLK